MAVPVSRTEKSKYYSDGHTKLASLPSMQRHVVKAADVTVEVEKLEEKSDSVERMVRESGGFVANNQSNFPRNVQLGFKFNF